MPIKTWHITVSHREPVRTGSRPGGGPEVALAKKFILYACVDSRTRRSIGGLLCEWLCVTYQTNQQTKLFELHWSCWSPAIRRRRVLAIQRSITGRVKYRRDAPNSIFIGYFRPCFLYVPSPSTVDSIYGAREQLNPS